MGEHHYNTYSSTYNSNSRQILYLALNRHGAPRKLQIPPSRSLGKLATYTKSLTEIVSDERTQELIGKLFGKNRIGHGVHHLCDAGKPLVNLTKTIFREPPSCKEYTASLTNLSTTTLEYRRKRILRANSGKNKNDKKNLKENFKIPLWKNITIRRTELLSRNVSKKIHCENKNNLKKKEGRQFVNEYLGSQCNSRTQNSVRKYVLNYNKNLKLIERSRNQVKEKGVPAVNSGVLLSIK